MRLCTRQMPCDSILFSLYFLYCLVAVESYNKSHSTIMPNNGMQSSGQDDVVVSSGSCRSAATFRLLLTSSGLVSESMQTTAKTLYQEAVKDTQMTTIIYVVDAVLEPRRYNISNNNQSREVSQMTQSMQREWNSISANSRVSAPIVKGVELATLPDGGAETLLSNAACVYLEQGNTYYLLYQLRRTLLDEAIVQQLLPRGGLLVGASAGSIVSGRTIRTCEWKNWDDPGHGTFWDCRTLPTKLDGLNLLHGSTVGQSIFPH
jgi:Peptidase family S51